MLVDYDTYFAQLDSITLIGNATVGQSWVLGFDVDHRRSPLLLISNALIGQSATTLPALAAGPPALTASEIKQLALDRWSTVDPRMSPASDAHAGELKILADGRVIDLTPLEPMPVSLGRRKELHVPPHGDVVAHAYPVDTATLHFIAASRELTVLMPQEPLDTPFQLWEDGRPALEQFAQRASGS
jgi:hypothetical protein